MTTALMDQRAAYSGRNVLAGVLNGVGIAGFIDETIFHQLLHWHHFYDRASLEAGLVSDGLFHAGSWFAMVASLFLFADLRRRGAYWPARWWGALLVGLGGFQLYDGTIQHKLIQLHQIRYVENIAPYDWTWNVLAALFIATGVTLLVRTRPGAAVRGARDTAAVGNRA